MMKKVIIAAGWLALIGLLQAMVIYLVVEGILEP
jgi:hypothetical protein